MLTIDELRALGGRIAYTPVGVIRIEFSKTQMYHFFSVHAPPLIADNIHTHPHSFTSNVIKGGIRNHIYRVEDSVPETNYCVRSILFRAANKNDGTKTAALVRENVLREKIVTFDTYANGKYNIHDSTMHMIDILEPKTITLLTCDPYIGAIGETYFVMGKDVSYTKEQLHKTKSRKECWDIVADTLA